MSVKSPPSLRTRRDSTEAYRDLRYEAQPSLLDRLTSDRSQTASDFGRSPAPSNTQMRDSILRDLGWLMNSPSIESIVDLDGYSHVQQSVVNFGVGTLNGTRALTTSSTDIESAIRAAIVQFEPRILAESLEVRCAAEPSAARPPNTLLLEISGQLWKSQPPRPFFARSELDLDSGQFTLRSRREP